MGLPCAYVQSADVSNAARTGVARLAHKREVRQKCDA